MNDHVLKSANGVWRFLGRLAGRLVFGIACAVLALLCFAMMFQPTQINIALLGGVVGTAFWMPLIVDGIESLITN